MNRILQFVGKSCACCRAREYVEACAEVAREIEGVTGELVEVVVQSPENVIDKGRLGIRAYVVWESEYLLLPNAAADVAAELRGLADSLDAAADALCAGGAA